MPSREEENDKVVNRDKPVVNSVTLPRGDSESLRRQEVFEIRMKSDVNHSCIQRAARLAYKRYPYFKSRFKTIDGSLFGCHCLYHAEGHTANTNFIKSLAGFFKRMWH